MSSKLVNFQTTRWSLVGELCGPDADTALAELCQQYWQPLYAFVRQRYQDEHRAQDLTQGFFCHLISKNALRHADPERGRFRTFLLAAFRNYLSNEQARRVAHLRGGDHVTISLDFVQAEQLYQKHRLASATPQQQFERAWTLQLIDRAIRVLRMEYRESNNEAKFEVLEPTLASSSARNSTRAIADKLGVSSSTARKMVSRFRQQFRDVLRTEVMRLVHDPADVEDEIKQMFQSLS